MQDQPGDQRPPPMSRPTMALVAPRAGVLDSDVNINPAHCFLGEMDAGANRHRRHRIERRTGSKLCRVGRECLHATED